MCAAFAGSITDSDGVVLQISVACVLGLVSSTEGVTGYRRLTDVGMGSVTVVVKEGRVGT